MIKRCLFFLLLSFSLSLAYAQSFSDNLLLLREVVEAKVKKYLTVKGVELKPGLSMEECLKQFELKGLTRSESFDIAKKQFGVFTLEGTFFNRANCSIKIIPSTNDKNIVGVIGINLPYEQSFKKLKNDYDDLKSSLMEKYYLAEYTESFDDDYIEKSTSDRLKLSALANNECLFKSIFYISDVEGGLCLGQVVLTISHIEVEREDLYYVSLSYCTPDNIMEQLTKDEDL